MKFIMKHGKSEKDIKNLRQVNMLGIMFGWGGAGESYLAPSMLWGTIHLYHVGKIAGPIAMHGSLLA